MDLAARHLAFVWSAYGLAATIVLGLVLRAVIDHRAQLRALDRLTRDPGSDA